MESDEELDQASDWTQLDSMKAFECKHKILEHSSVYTFTPYTVQCSINDASFFLFPISNLMCCVCVLHFLKGLKIHHSRNCYINRLPAA